MTQALQVVILVVAALGAALVVMVRGRVRQVVAPVTSGWRHARQA